MTKVEITLEVEIDNGVLNENNKTIKDIIKEITVYQDDVVDGIVLTRRSNNSTEEFYIKNEKIAKIDIKWE